MDENNEQEFVEKITSVTAIDYATDHDGITRYTIEVVTNLRSHKHTIRYSEILQWKDRVLIYQLLTPAMAEKLPKFPGKFRTSGDPETRVAMFNAFFRFIYEESQWNTSDALYSDWLHLGKFESSQRYSPVPALHPSAKDHSKRRSNDLDKLTPLAINALPVVDVPATCSICGKVCRDQKGLEQHELSHSQHNSSKY